MSRQLLPALVAIPVLTCVTVGAKRAALAAVPLVVLPVRSPPAAELPWPLIWLDRGEPCASRRRRQGVLALLPLVADGSGKSGGAQQQAPPGSATWVYLGLAGV